MDDKFTFFTDSITLKTRVDEDGEKQHYVEGYISTDSIDLGNDIVTKEAMEDMAEQIKNTSMKLDLEHEGPKKSLNIVPVGRIIEAKVDKKGLWIKAQINKHSSKFREVWGSIKSGMLDGFSIAYRAIKAVSKIVEGKTVRILSEVKLINVALTGIPMNEDCRIGAVMTKSIKYLEQEEKNMEEEKKPTPETEAEAPQTEATPEPEAVEKKESEVINKVNLEEEIKSLKEALDKMATEVKTQTTVTAEIKQKLEAAEEAMAKPQLKSEVASDIPAPLVEEESPKSPLQMIN